SASAEKCSTAVEPARPVAPTIRILFMARRPSEALALFADDLRQVLESLRHDIRMADGDDRLEQHLEHFVRRRSLADGAAHVVPRLDDLADRQRVADHAEKPGAMVEDLAAIE